MPPNVELSVREHDLATEPLLQEEGNRYVMFPVNPKYQKLYEMYQQHLANFWTVDELDLEKDPKDWEKLSDDERHFIKHVLAFFAASDGIVNENLGERFMSEVMITEARSFYSVQNCMETVHSQTYSQLIETFIKDDSEKMRLFNAIETIPCIKKKADWAIKWINSDDASFAKRLVAFACVEGVFFSGAFCSIFWLRQSGRMPGLCFSNTLISADEALHTEFAVELYKHIVNRLSKEEMEELMREAVVIEEEFIVDSLPCSLLGMNSELMKQYIQFVADRLLLQLGYDKIWGVKNPFPFMDRTNLDKKENFFEGRVGNYQKAQLHRPSDNATGDMTQTTKLNFNPDDADDF